MEDAFSIQGMHDNLPQVTTTTLPVVNLELDPSPIEVSASVTAAYSLR